MCFSKTRVYESCLQSHEPKLVGNWALVVKRDYFNKVAGGVRQQEKLDAHSELVKIRSASFLYLFLMVPTPCWQHICSQGVTDPCCVFAHIP